MFRFHSNHDRLAAAPGVENRLWSEMTLRFDQGSYSDMRVLVLGFETDARVWLRNSLRLIGVRATATASNLAQLAMVADMKLSFTHVIVNLDGYEFMEDAVDALFDFRQRSKDVVVIAISAMVASDDLGLERRAICDATLRLPLTERRLRRGLVEGRANNLATQQDGLTG
jgi:CheY-like chemotaxis protein